MSVLCLGGDGKKTAERLQPPRGTLWLIGDNRTWHFPDRPSDTTASQIRMMDASAMYRGGMCAVAFFDSAPQFLVHATPTSSLWLNQVERCFAELTDAQIAATRGTPLDLPARN